MQPSGCSTCRFDAKVPRSLFLRRHAVRPYERGFGPVPLACAVAHLGARPIRGLPGHSLGDAIFTGKL